MSLRPLYLAIVLMATAAPAPAATPFEDIIGLKWCFQREKPFFQEITTETKQNLTVMGMDIANAQKQTFHYRWQLIKYDAALKQWHMKQKLEALKMEVEIGGQKTSYDSTKPDEAKMPLAEALGAMVGVEFTVIINAEGRVTRVDGCETATEKIKKALGGPNPMLTGLFREEAMRSMVEQSLPIVPAKPRGAVREWVKEGDIDMGPLGGYSIKHTYTEVGRDGRFEKIRVAPALAYRAPAPATDPKALPFLIKKSDLKSTDCDGMIHLDPREGRVDHSNLKIKLAGKMTISIGGTDHEVSLEQTQVITVKTFDVDPLKK